MGCASFSPHPLLPCEHDCTWRSPLRSANGLQGDKPAPPWASLGCKELLFHAWNICLPSALTLGQQCCFSHVYSLLSQLLLHSSSVLFGFLNTFILKSTLPEAHSVLLMAQAAATGATGAGCDLTWSSAGIWLPCYQNVTTLAH